MLLYLVFCELTLFCLMHQAQKLKLQNSDWLLLWEQKQTKKKIDFMSLVFVFQCILGTLHHSSLWIPLTSTENQLQKIKGNKNQTGERVREQLQMEMWPSTSPTPSLFPCGNPVSHLPKNTTGEVWTHFFHLTVVLYLHQISECGNIKWEITSLLLPCYQISSIWVMAYLL